MTRTSTPHPVEQRESAVTRVTHKLEAVFDAVLRPGAWAAGIAYHAGLQGRLRITEANIRGASAAPRARPLRIAFASDFHAGPTTDRRMLERACAALSALEPDVLLLGGDFVSVYAADVEQLEPYLARVNAPYGKFAVMGNHDLRGNSDVIVSALERCGVGMLTNARLTLPAPFDDITICGLDDPTSGDPRPDLAIDGATGTRIVLMHSPDALESIGNRHFDLALCGHTHGGQIALPWDTPILVPGGALNRQYFHGQFDLGGDSTRTMIVSRGVGCSALPARLFAPPEVHLCLIT